MSRKLHLIVFMLKLDVSLPTFHTSVKRKKLTFNPYNYNFFLFFLFFLGIIFFSTL